MTTSRSFAPARPASAPLPNAVDAPPREFRTTDDWRLGYYADLSGAGRPLVLLHSVNAAASSFEVRPLFEHYRKTRPVYCLDLPGFGLSDRLDRIYSPEFFATAIGDFLAGVVGEMADVLALSLSSEFAARATLLRPGLVASLVFVSPTGFELEAAPASGFTRTMRALLSVPAFGKAVFGLVSSRPSIRMFLRRSFVGPAALEMADYGHLTAHMAGAHLAPLAFVSGRLFTSDAARLLYDHLGDLPVLVVADRDPYVGFERLAEFVETHQSWTWIRLAPHLGLPQWERLQPMVAALDQFWAA